MKNIILALDCGKNSVKAYGRDADGSAEDLKKVLFRTKYYDLDDGYSDVQGNSFKVAFNDKSYIVGEQGKTDDTDTSKTTFIHQLCAYTAITQFLEPGSKGNKIQMVLACPLSVLKVAEAKEEYKSLIKGTGPISMNVNDNEYEFEITEIMVKAEGSGILYLEKELFKDGDVGVIDFGGLNMNFCIYRNGVADVSTRVTAEFGVNKLLGHVENQLSIMNKGNIMPPEDVERALEDGYTLKDGSPYSKSIEHIEKAKEIYLKEAIDFIHKKGHKLDNLKSNIFVGGTTLKIKDAIKKQVKNNNIIPDAQWTTAEGLYLIAYNKYGKKN